MNMKIEIGQNTYTDIFDITFTPEVDLLSETMPTNSFEAKIKTRDNISLGSKASLKEDDFLYAYYDITSVKRIDDDVVQIKAEDVLAKLDRVILPSYYYNDYSFDIAMYFFAMEVSRQSYSEITVNIGLPSQETYPTISGCCPEQTARERLQLLCMMAGYYIITLYSTYDAILNQVPTDFNNPYYIPEKNIAWIPQNSDQNFVTRFKIDSYALTSVSPGTLQTVDDYIVTDTPTTQYWKYTITTYTWTNPYAAGAVPNEVEIVDNALINANNINDLLLRIMNFYQAGGIEIEVDTLNSPTVYPIGSLVSFPTGIGRQIAIGYIKAQNFIFGNTSKITTTVRIVYYKQGYYLYLHHISQDGIIRSEKYLFPDGYQYSFNLKSEQVADKEKIKIFNPQSQSVSGTISGDDINVNVTYDLAMMIDDGVAAIKGARAVAQSSDILAIGGSQSYDKPDDEISIYYSDDDLLLLVQNGKMSVGTTKTADQAYDELRL